MVLNHIIRREELVEAYIGQGWKRKLPALWKKSNRARTAEGGLILLVPEQYSHEAERSAGLRRRHEPVCRGFKFQPLASRVESEVAAAPSSWTRAGACCAYLAVDAVASILAFTG